MRIKDRICDVCGCSVYRHAAHTYTIRKRFWETETIGRRLDLCEDCWRNFEHWVLGKMKHSGRVMTTKQNVRAILETCFTEAKDELIEIATRDIMLLFENQTAIKQETSV